MNMMTNGHSLPGTIYTEMKKKQLLSICHLYKQLFQEAIHDIISFDKYSDFITDTEIETIYQPQQYVEKKVHNSNIVDVFLAASQMKKCKQVYLNHHKHLQAAARNISGSHFHESALSSCCW